MQENFNTSMQHNQSRTQLGSIGPQLCGYNIKQHIMTKVSAEHQNNKFIRIKHDLNNMNANSMCHKIKKMASNKFHNQEISQAVF